jgi:hypothetical protein
MSPITSQLLSEKVSTARKAKRKGRMFFIGSQAGEREADTRPEWFIILPELTKG